MRGCDSDNSLLGAAASLEPQELGLKVAVLLAGGGPGTLHQHRLQPGGALSDAGRAALAGTLVEARNETRPGQEMTRRRELPHVVPISAMRIWAEVSLRPGTSFSRSMASRKGSSAASIRASKAAIVFLQLLNGLQMLADEEAMMLAHAAVQRICKLCARCSEPRTAELG